MSPVARRLTLLALVLVAALFVRLGFWQLGRREERRAANRAAAQARAEPPRELGVGADRKAEELNERWAQSHNLDEWTQFILKQTEDVTELITQAPASGIWKAHGDGAMRDGLRSDNARSGRLPGAQRRSGSASRGNPAAGRRSSSEARGRRPRA